jgi:CubicO group peptidase (beta-lactamase class C family)
MYDELKDYLDKLVVEGVFPGYNYGIVLRDEIITGYGGYKSLKPRKIKNKFDNIYDIASLTKLIVTNTIVSFMLRDKLLDLQDSVSKYLPLNEEYKDVKIIHLLTHASGIYSLVDKNDIKDKNDFISKMKLEFEPGSQAKYRDINFILLGFIIEKVYNKPINELALELVFKPLDMKSTTYLPKDKHNIVPTEDMPNRGMVLGEVHDEKAYFLGGVAGHAGVFSNITDITHFINMVLHNGFYNGKEFIESKYIDIWFQPLFMDDEDHRRTLGWIYGPTMHLCKDSCGDDAIAHTGFPGHFIVIDRSNDLGIIFLSNRIHPSRDNIEFLTRREEVCNTIYKLLKKYNKIY